MTALATRPVSRTPSTPSAPGIDDRVAAIEQEMQLASGSLSVESVVRIEERFQELRATALREGPAMASHMDRLRALRIQFERLKAPLARQLVDELYRMRSAIQRAQEREQTVRETVIWLSRSAGNDELRGDCAGASVRSSTRHIVPESGSPGRARLESIIREQRLWEEVSIIHGPRLGKAIDAGRFTGAGREEVARLCPRVASHSVRTYEAGPGTPGSRRPDPLTI
ncbi:MAG: hypothetical protein WD749_04140 [Phycisphaerales bacterium]